jgi:hypothetical protein
MSGLVTRRPFLRWIAILVALATFGTYPNQEPEYALGFDTSAIAP